MRNPTLKHYTKSIQAFPCNMYYYCQVKSQGNAQPITQKYGNAQQITRKYGNAQQITQKYGNVQQITGRPLLLHCRVDKFYLIFKILDPFYSPFTLVH